MAKTTTAPASTTAAWGTTKAHGLKDGDTFLYGGMSRLAANDLRRVTVSKDGATAYRLVSHTGAQVASMGVATRYWAAPLAKATKATPAPKAEAKAPAVAAQGHPGHTWFNLVEKAGTTRMAVARTMGVAPMTLHRLVAGDAVPTARMTVLFAKAINDLGGKADVQALWAEVAAYELAQALQG